MNDFNPALVAACDLISYERAEELVRLRNWQNGGCLTIRERPTIDDVTSVEDAAIKTLWKTLPGSSCWMSALYMIRNHPRTTEDET